MRPVWSALLLVLCLAGAPARAAVGRYLSVGDAAARAQVVVEGTVTASESRDDALWHRFVTVVTVKVERAWRGQPTTVQVLLLGGEVGERVQLVPGEASLAVGERVLLFLEPVPGREQLRPVGMRQGVFRPAREGWRRDFDGLSVISPGEAAAHPQAPEALPLIDLPQVLTAHPFEPALHALPTAPAAPQVGP